MSAGTGRGSDGSCGEAGPLAPGEVRVYVVDEAAPDLHERLDGWRGLMSAEEAARWQRFRLAHLRDRHLAARALVRGVLSLHMPQVAPRDWRFSQTAHGKPVLDGETAGRIGFNLSHTDGRLVLAVALAPAVGVDIERRDREAEMLDLADRFFARGEAAALRALPQADRRRRFFDLWTLKEAYIKAQGLGLSLPLSSFEIDFPQAEGREDGDPGRLTLRLPQDAAPTTALPGGPGDAPWHLWCLDAGADHALALALCGEDDWRPRLFTGLPPGDFRETACRVLRRTAPLGQASRPQEARRRGSQAASAAAFSDDGKP
ncbi:4'-phosphopantetheinyl transferase family protein [Methylobrevis pamukkalensis]|uniref:4'-phosphopantetheinyl transferase family protein n=1 Tax=Methylobrevis pamukkalensis TaxID=1439726 RepID=UPI00147225EA|nr:4'-phosphopantetheinyl transferase superfamily protein [Methylobrevis pamukkalensis]